MEERIESNVQWKEQDRTDRTAWPHSISSVYSPIFLGTVYYLSVAPTLESHYTCKFTSTCHITRVDSSSHAGKSLATRANLLPDMWSVLQYISKISRDSSDNREKLFHWAAEECFGLEACKQHWKARHYKWPAMPLHCFLWHVLTIPIWAKQLNSSCISFKVPKLSWLFTACGAFIFVEIYEWGCNCGCLIVVITEVSQIYLCVYINSDYTCIMQQ